MATFVHLTSVRLAGRIRRSGIAARSWGPFGRSVYALPVVPSYYVTHQWVRELRKWGHGAIVGVYFRLPDEELVSVGRFGHEHESVMAVQATQRIIELGHTALGYEVIVPHRILPAAIRHIRPLSPRIGWRHYPTAHGRRPCGCPSCTYGEYNARRLREAV